VGRGSVNIELVNGTIRPMANGETPATRDPLGISARIMVDVVAGVVVAVAAAGVVAGVGLAVVVVETEPC